MKTVKCNPTWEASARLLLEVVKYGDTPEAKDNAANEIIRGMRGYDGMLRKHTNYFDSA